MISEEPVDLITVLTCTTTTTGIHFELCDRNIRLRNQNTMYNLRLFVSVIWCSMKLMKRYYTGIVCTCMIPYCAWLLAFIVMLGMIFPFENRHENVQCFSFQFHLSQLSVFYHLFHCPFILNAPKIWHFKHVQVSSTFHIGTFWMD